MTLLQNHVQGDMKEIILCVSSVAMSVAEQFQFQQGKIDSTNQFGEQQTALDLWANHEFIASLRACPIVREIASEEENSLIPVRDSGFGVTIDPLDGSSLIDLNLTVGSIFSIHKKGILNSSVAGAVYVMYGPLTTLVYSIGQGVHEFASAKDGFMLQREKMIIPDGKIYSIGGRRKKWTPTHQKYIERLEFEGYKLRYSGGFTPDFHQVLRNGGIFSYPALIEKPNGKLRLLFEANPMCFIARQAGGAASTGKQRIETVQPRSLADRTPLYIGGKKEIQMIEQMEAEHVLP
jgi:fructose-1,6-bisphosphatase I